MTQEMLDSNVFQCVSVLYVFARVILWRFTVTHCVLLAFKSVVKFVESGGSTLADCTSKLGL